MTPNFQVLANSQDITNKLRDRLLSLQITDEVGFRADTLTLQLDDVDNALAWPVSGAELEVHLGYQERGITRMGLYIVDEVEHRGPPAMMTIRAKAANMRASMKAPTSMSWHDTTLGDLVTTIALQHGLLAKVSEALSSIELSHLDQTVESDLHLLTRLARTYGAIAKPAGHYLIFVKRGEARTAANQLLATVRIAPQDMIRHRMLQVERSRYQAVRAYWHDYASAETQSVLVGEGEPVDTLRHPYATQDQAQHAALARFAALQRGTATLSITVLGDPAIQAEGKIIIEGLRAPIAGAWSVQRVRHQLDGQGFNTHVETESLKA